MIKIDVDTDGQFRKQMDNLVEYTEGFFEGVQRGKKNFLQQLAESIKEMLENFIDVNARVNPESLHHVYEWYQAGNSDARLFEISYVVKDSEISLSSSFSQSQSIASGSKEPFYNKAAVMESGASITIRPKRADFLKFETAGDTVFTPNQVFVRSPGGPETAGGFKKTHDSFFTNYFNQSFIQFSGMRQAFSDMSMYSKNLGAGLQGGRPVGVSTGYRWITNIRMEKA